MLRNILGYLATFLAVLCADCISGDITLFSSAHIFKFNFSEKLIPFLLWPPLAIIAAYQTNIRRQRCQLQTSLSSDTETSEDLDSDEYSYDLNKLRTP